jgi:hypothetical protein
MENDNDYTLTPKSYKKFTIYFDDLQVKIDIYYDLSEKMVKVGESIISFDRVIKEELDMNSENFQIIASQGRSNTFNKLKVYLIENMDDTISDLGDPVLMDICDAFIIHLLNGREIGIDDIHVCEGEKNGIIRTPSSGSDYCEWSCEEAIKEVFPDLNTN